MNMFVIEDLLEYLKRAFRGVWGRRGSSYTAEHTACGAKREGVTGDWRKFHTEELHDLCSSPNNNWMIKLRNMSWVDYVARMGKREMDAGCSYGNLEERGNLEVLGVDG